ncbi:MAG: NERD domain-containing protein [Ruminococcaceae bacterium]|nr:NERD domain-containing protein [Oscillospiraceae bacterium]
MSRELYVILAVFGGINLIAAVFLLFHKLKKDKEIEKISHYGDYAETQVSNYLKKNFPDGVCLNNIYLKTNNGLTQLDHILICKYGLFAIETKSHNGFIDIGQRQWTQKYNDKIVKFHNPVHQNEIHKKALRNIIATDRSFRDLNVNGFVVFTSKNVRFSEQVREVVSLNQLASFVKSSKAYRQDTMRKYSRDTRDPMRGMMTRSSIQRLERLILKNSEKSKLKHKRHSSKIRNFRKY